MRLSQLLPAAAIAGLTSAMIVVGSVSVPSVQAQTRITVPGAGPLYYPNIIAELPLGRFYLVGTDVQGGEPLSILEGYALLNHVIGENWFPGSTAQVVNYPASIGLLSGSLAAPGVDDAVAMGRASLDDQIMNAVAGGDRAVIAGLSEGTIVISRELAYLARSPSAPPADRLSFVLFSGPEPGLFDIYLPPGFTVPLFNYTAQSMPDSQYDVSVVFHQYDGWADPPDRPWNLLAVVNALVGSLYFHNSAALAVPSDALEVSSVTSDLGGTTTTYMIPSFTLPILKPLQQLGFPTQVIDALNSALKPIVDAGYSRLSPDAGPYFSHGQLLGLPSLFGSPTPAPARVDESTANANPSPDSTSARIPDSPRGAVDPVSQAVAVRPATRETAEVPSGPTANGGDSASGVDTATEAMRSATGTTPDGPVDIGGQSPPKSVTAGVEAPTTSSTGYGVPNQEAHRTTTPGDNNTSRPANSIEHSGSTADPTNSDSDPASSSTSTSVGSSHTDTGSAA